MPKRKVPKGVTHEAWEKQFEIDRRLDRSEETHLMRTIWDDSHMAMDLHQSIDPNRSLLAQEKTLERLTAVKIQLLRNLQELRGCRFRLGLEREPDPILPEFLRRFALPDEYKTLDELFPKQWDQRSWTERYRAMRAELESQDPGGS
jgi:hypothetical protein